MDASAVPAAPKLPDRAEVRELALQACGCTFALRCADDGIAALVTSAFGALIVSPSAASAAVRLYDIDHGTRGGYRVSADGEAVLLDDADGLLFHLDKSIIIALQYERRELFFLHAAAVVRNGRAIVLSAAAGTGKSTLTLALVEEGFGYLSDEIAPIDLERLSVAPYPHALYLKSAPPPPRSLPAGAVEHAGRFYVPPEALPGVTHRAEAPVFAFVFLRRDRERFDGLRPMSAASGAARLMAHALNPLAHAGDGLDAAVALASRVPAFELDTTDLAAARAALEEIVR